MLRWLKRRLVPDRYQGHTAAEWYGFYRNPQYFSGDLASAVTEALRRAVATRDEPSDIEIPPVMSVLLATDDREGVRCLVIYLHVYLRRLRIAYSRARLPLSKKIFPRTSPERLWMFRSS